MTALSARPHLLAWILAPILLSLGSLPSEAQIFRWLAFGDSITEAWSDDPGQGGYPARLEDDLGCSPSTCQVYNAGKSFETAAEGVSRIDPVIDNQGPFDVALIMEGTNDIWGPNNINNVSIPTILFNLTTIANKAEAKGVEAVPTSIIWLIPGGHPKNTVRNPLVQDLRDQLMSTASLHSRLFVDQWSILCPSGPGQSNCFNNHYWHCDPDIWDCPVENEGLPDVVGHPDASGFNLMANEFFARINSTPVPSAATPVSPTGVIGDSTPTLTWTKESPVRASWYQVRVTGPGGTPFQKWVKASQVCSGNTCSTEVADPLNDNSFNWQVMSRNARGRSGWSAQQGFTVSTGGLFADGFESGNTAAWTETVP